MAAHDLWPSPYWQNSSLSHHDNTKGPCLGPQQNIQSSAHILNYILLHQAQWSQAQRAQPVK